MAKGVEDTAFYRYVRLLALNEVGGDPGRFGSARRRRSTTPNGRARARGSPRRCSPGTTHDTKRSADVRARIGALAWLADEWAEQVARVAPAERVAPRRDGAPDWTEELLVYQTLVGAWPIEPERLDRLPR